MRHSLAYSVRHCVVLQSGHGGQSSYINTPQHAVPADSLQQSLMHFGGSPAAPPPGLLLSFWCTAQAVRPNTAWPYKQHLLTACIK